MKKAQNIKLVSPTMQEIDTISLIDLPNYLKERNLDSIKTNQRNTYIICPTIILEKVKEVTNGNITKINIQADQRKNKELMKEALTKYGYCVFVCSPKELRHYYNAKGFAISMRKLKDQEEDIYEIIPPGCYGNVYLFGLAKRDTSFQT